jgi:hypothetical protein
MKAPDGKRRKSTTNMIVWFLYGQLRIGWDELDHYPERTTWRGLFVVVSIGYIPAVATAGLFCVLKITKLLY